MSASFSENLNPLSFAFRTTWAPIIPRSSSLGSSYIVCGTELEASGLFYAPILPNLLCEIGVALLLITLFPSLIGENTPSLYMFFFAEFSFQVSSR